ALGVRAEDLPDALGTDQWRARPVDTLPWPHRRRRAADLDRAGHAYPRLAFSRDSRPRPQDLPDRALEAEHVSAHRESGGGCVSVADRLEQLTVLLDGLVEARHAVEREE